jgi:glutamine amidotransferase-like uncharacterized protein
MTQALKSKYKLVTFSEEECNSETLSKFDIVAFPGGIGEASSYDTFFRRKAQNAVADYVADGGRYLGICMGAYWAGSYYFDILDGVDAFQYIWRPDSDIKRSYGTVAPALWNGKKVNMYFYDGCALIGDSTKFKTIATYANGDPMAIIQNRIGIIGCHPESLKYWYEAPWNYINKHWHDGEHHRLLLEFVDELMTS